VHERYRSPRAHNRIDRAYLASISRASKTNTAQNFAAIDRRRQHGSNLRDVRADKIGIGR
jgi:hypothetical protein